MKKIIAFLTFIFAASIIYAQGPQALNYQAIVRNSSGTTITNSSVSVRFSIHESTATGTIVYSETDSGLTNQFGLFSCQIGTGTVQSGNFSSINWGTGNKYLEVEFDPTGSGLNYTSMGTNQLLSVPYALYALSGNQGPIGLTGATGPTGATGAAGTNGTKWFSGTTVPGSGTGAINDFYLRTTTGEYYKKTGAAVWTLQANLTGPTGAPGAQGPAGSANINGNANYLIKFSNSNTGANSQIYESGTFIGIGTTTPPAILSLSGGGFDASQGLAITNTNTGGKTLTINQGNVGKINFTEPGVYDLVTMDFNTNRVGIGTTSPICPLDINGGSSLALASGWGSYRLFSWDADYSVTDGTTQDISLHTNHAIWAGWGIYSTSDERIKKDFIVSDNEKDLATLNNIKVTDFRYKDAIEYGKAYKKGFIAQQVKQVFPQAISVQKDFISDIFSLPVSSHLVNNSLVITMHNIHGLCNGDQVRLMTDSEKKEVTVEVNNDYTFTVKNWNSTDTEVFVYGKKVDDFLIVDYERIFTLNVSATQELIKRVELLEKENAEQKQIIKELTESTRNITRSCEQILDSNRHLKAEAEAIKNLSPVNAQQ